MSVLRNLTAPHGYVVLHGSILLNPYFSATLLQNSSAEYFDGLLLVAP